MSALAPAARPGRRPRTARVVGAVVLAAVLAVMLYPLLWLATAAFKPAEEIFSSDALLPSRIEWSNFTEGWAIGGIGFGRFFVNSMLLSAGAVLCNVVACSAAAYAFARLRFRLRGPLFALTIATLMLPAHVTVIPQYVLFQQAGLVDTFVPLLLPKLLATDAFFVFLIVQFIRGIPSELDEAARLDGCGSYRIFWHVLLPLVRPALITTAIFTFLWTYNDFFSQLIYLSSTENYTVPLGLRLFLDQSTQSAYGPMFAMSVLALGPILLFYLAFQRYLVDGMATSGLKG